MREAREHTRAAARLGRLLGTIFAAALVLWPAEPHAQYFGRNKVLWERFDFEILETEHFEIHYYPPDAPHAEYVADLAERWHARLARFFDHELTERKPLIIYQNHADFQQTVVTPGLIGEGTGGFTESALDRIVLPLTGINADNDHVIGHELVHAFQFDIARSLRQRNVRVQLNQMPLWAIEGLAEYLSQGRVDPVTSMWMRDAVLHDQLPDPGRFIQRLPSPYHYGQALYAYVAGRWSDDIVAALFLRFMTSGVNRAFEQVLGLEAQELYADFHAALAAASEPVLEGRRDALEFAEPLLGTDTTGARVNIAPSLSPDGRRIAFLSTRALELELFLADTETGEVIRRLVRSESDRHFQNLSFLDASVAWSPDGRRFAFGAFARGERVIALYDLEQDRVERRLDLPGIGDMRHPAFTPDGRAIVFSGMVGGASDLFRIDLETGNVTRLTEDAYTAIQPSVSPDGRQIAFVTDRGPNADLDRLAFGELKLAVLDVESGEIELLPYFEQGKHLDPHFSSDGRFLYFIAEPDGVPDVFRYDFSSDGIERITALRTGATGLTGTSPALSVADDGLVAFSVLEDGGYTVYRMRSPVGVPAERSADMTAAVLPPESSGPPDLVARLLTDPDFGLPTRAPRRETRDYNARIGLTALAPATIGVASTVGGNVGLGGALSAYFTDALNRHQIVTTFQGGSTEDVLDFEDTIGADVTYLNQTRRFQWGGRIARIPYLSSGTFFSREIVEVDGTAMPADVVERLIVAEQVNDFSLLGWYPFSLNNRVELAAGVSQLDFERHLQRVVFPDAAPAFREAFSLPSPSGLDLRQASIAFVRDTSTFAFLSPARGTRLRLEQQWTRGDLELTTTRIDLRRYFFREPLTFALRALHLGRHGSGADDPRLPQLDIGNSNLIRGYELDSFELAECTAVPGTTACPEFDRLVGSRIAVLNFELRLALLGTEDVGLFSVPAAPTEAVLFIDAGAAWSSGQSVDWSFRRDSVERVPVFSAGLAVRTLLLGALPLEVYYAVPFQRPEEDSVFGFRIGAGW